MGFYAERPDGAPTNKAQGIAEAYGGLWTHNMALAEEALAQGKGVFCVVNNYSRGFEAAAFVIDEREWEAFHDKRDLRPRLYVIMDRQKAEEISGYDRYRRAQEGKHNVP